MRIFCGVVRIFTFGVMTLTSWDFFDFVWGRFRATANDPLLFDVWVLRLPDFSLIVFVCFRFLHFCKNSSGCIHGGHITHGRGVLVDRGELAIAFMHAWFTHQKEQVAAAAEDAEINTSIKIKGSVFYV